jgi:putative transposase
MDENQRRIETIRRVAQGESITDVCAELNRSRVWYYKWLKRFRDEGVSGLADQRSQHSPSHTTPDWLKDLAIETRDRLVRQAETGTSFQGIGAREVVCKLQRLKIDVPHWITIHRILGKAADYPVYQVHWLLSTSHREWSELSSPDRHLAPSTPRR